MQGPYGLVVRTEAGVLRETTGYFQTCLQQAKPDLFQGKVGPSVAVFLATEPGLLKVHLWTFPSVFVAIESRYFTGAVGPSLAVFAVTELGVLMETLEYFQPCL